MSNDKQERVNTATNNTKPEQPRLSDNVIVRRAVDAVCDALEQLNPEQQRRALNMAHIALGLASNAPRQQQRPQTQTPNRNGGR